MHFFDFENIDELIILDSKILILYYKDFKGAYTSDLSLLLAMKDFSLRQHIVENTLSGNTKGGFLNV